MNATPLQDRVALVTGATRGIGRAIAATLASRGAIVVATGRDPAAGGETVAAIEQNGGRACFVESDIGDEGAISELLDRVSSEYGRLDALVNNAGISRLEGVDNETAEGWNQVLAINLTAPFLLVHHAVPLLTSPGGAVVNLGSVLGTVGMRDVSAYCAAKGGLHQLTRQLALDLASRGIRVNCVAPGFIRTDMYELGHPADKKRRIESLHALGRAGEPGEVANAVAFLVSDEASFITGACLAVDGGLTAQFGL